MSYNASSTYKSFLMRSTDGETYTKVIDIKTFPDMGGEPSNLQTTTMTDGAHTGIPGLQALLSLRLWTDMRHRTRAQTLTTLCGSEAQRFPVQILLRQVRMVSSRGRDAWHIRMLRARVLMRSVRSTS